MESMTFTDARATSCALIISILAILLFAGCAEYTSRSDFAAPRKYAPTVPSFPSTEPPPNPKYQRIHDHIHRKLHHHKKEQPIDPVMAAIEGHYKQANEHEQKFKPECLYHYYQAATLSWPLIRPELTPNVEEESRVWKIYHSSLSKLSVLPPRFNLFDPSQGITIPSPAGNMVLPVSYTGFPWYPEDFQQLSLVTVAQSDDLARYHSYEGVGIPIIVEGKRDPAPDFMRPDHAFAATTLLRPSSEGTWVFSFYDPVRVRDITVGAQNVPLARDLTAPFVAKYGNPERKSLQGLLRPDSPVDSAKLQMIEPFQPGKIPIVFVHGLASDRFTWANMANDLRADPAMIDRYQILAFQYPTGRPFLESAAKLRQQLTRLRQGANPQGEDIAFDQMVIVGHSLGGLVAKLQVTYSQQTLWDSIAYEPFNSICVEPKLRSKLSEAFFFDPVPFVQRVVFIATPHLGSNYAQRTLGRVTSCLVKPSPQDVEAHRRLIADNPGVFSGQFRKRVPNSVDLLEPENRILLAIYKLRYSPQVKYHSIIGTGYHMKGGEGDKVVLVESAEQAGAASQNLVVARHSEIQRNPNTANDLIRIMTENLSSSPIVAPPSPPTSGPPINILFASSATVSPAIVAPPPVVTGFRLIPNPETPALSAAP